MYLDPATTANAVDDPQPVGEIPKRVQHFGFAPDLTRLQPGDLVLVAACKLDLQDRAIRNYQAARFGDRFSQWTHAAIHVENGVLVEALPAGVQANHIYDYVPSHRIAVRRYKQMTMADRLRVALHASLKIGKGYGLISVAQFFLSHVSKKISKGQLSAKFTICSELYTQAFIYGANKPLAGVPLDGTTTPAHLAASPDLTDINISWIRLARSGAA